MSNRIGTNFIGSSDLETSVANQEIIPDAPESWTIGYKFYKFEFVNDQICHIKINNGDAIYLRASQGFNSNEIDGKIESFKIVENDITFTWIGYY